MIGSTGWVPTLQMSTYVRARPGPGLARHPYDGRAGRRRDGRRDVRRCGTAGAASWASPPSWPGSASPTRSADPVLQGQRGAGLRRPDRRPPRPRRHRHPPRSSPTSSSPSMRGEAGWNRQRGHSASSWCLSLSFSFALPFPPLVSCVTVAGCAGRRCGAWNAKEPLPCGKRLLDVGTGKSLRRRCHLPACSAWGSHRPVPRTWPGATDPGSSPPGRTVTVTLCSVMIQPSIREPIAALAHDEAEFGQSSSARHMPRVGSGSRRRAMPGRCGSRAAEVRRGCRPPGRAAPA